MDDPPESQDGVSRQFVQVIEMPNKIRNKAQLVEVSFAQNGNDKPSVRIGGGVLKEISGIPQGSVRAFVHDKDRCELSTRKRRVFILVDTCPGLCIDEIESDVGESPPNRFRLYTQHNLDGERIGLKELRVFGTYKNRYGNIVLDTAYTEEAWSANLYVPTENMRKEGPEGLRPPFGVPWVIDAGHQPGYCWFGSPTLVSDGRQEGLKELKVANKTLLTPSKEA